MNHVIMANHMISLITSSTTDPSRLKTRFSYNSECLTDQGGDSYKCISIPTPISFKHIYIYTYISKVNFTYF